MYGMVLAEEIQQLIHALLQISHSPENSNLLFQPQSQSDDTIFPYNQPAECALQESLVSILGTFELVHMRMARPVRLIYETL